MKESKKPEKTVKKRAAFKVGLALPMDKEDEDKLEVLSSASKYCKYEDDFHEGGWEDEELGMPKVITSEVENLVEGRTPHIRNANHYGQKRLDSVLSRSVIMSRVEVCVDEVESMPSQVAQEFKNRRAEYCQASSRQEIQHPVGREGVERSFCALMDGKLREGSICAAIYPSECSGKREVEHFRVIYFDTLKESLSRLLGRYKDKRLDTWHFTGVKLSQYCPNIFWNIARIFHCEIDVGITEIFQSASSFMLERRRNSLEVVLDRSRPRLAMSKKAGRDADSHEQRESTDVSQELSKKLVEDLNRKIPYFERNGIEYYGASSEYLGTCQKSRMAQESSNLESTNHLFNKEGRQSDAGGQVSRRSSRRVSFGANGEASIIEAFIDQHYRIVHLPIHDYPERLKKVIYKYCILNEIYSCTIIKRDPLKGRCVVAGSSIRRDDFVLEYKGNLISQLAEARRLEEEYAVSKKGCYMYYFKYNDRNYCIDATEERIEFGPGRLINHSRKNPNIVTKVLMIDTVPRLFFVSKRNIMCGEELLFDYGDNNPISILHNPWLLYS